MTKAGFLRGNIIDKKSSDTIKAEIGLGERVVFEKRRGYILYYDTKRVLIQAGPYRKFESSLILNGKAYTSVLVFECGPKDACRTGQITKFYISKAKGLVAFERNNVLWTSK